VNDFYLSIMDWGRNNILAVALGSELYLWKSENGKVQRLLQVGAHDYPSSVSWSEDAKTLAVGYMHSNLQLWDAETSKLVSALSVCVTLFSAAFYFFKKKTSHLLLNFV
jgi:cell division cycle protein 20 (cofactor of APC complex)